MSAPTLHRPAPADARPREPASFGPAAPPERDRSESGVLIAVITLMIAACLPLTRVYVGLAVLRPVLAAVLLAVTLAWGCRRLGAGPLTALLASAAGWALLVSVLFLSDTLRLGLLPGTETLAAGRDLWLRGIELIRIRPAPALPEAGLVLVTVTGVWWIAHAVEGLVFRLRAPLRATSMALVLWLVPLAIAPPGGRPWVWAVPFLTAAALLLLMVGRPDLQRGVPSSRGMTLPGAPSGWTIAGLAIAAGALLGGLLPGFGEPPYYEVRGLGGTTITTNPIVSIRSSLVTLSDRPVARVRSPEPVYLRLTALDVYSDLEEWTSGGIRGSAASGRLPLETETPHTRELDVEVTIADLTGAIIVPAPYQPVRVEGDVTRTFQFDRDGATLTVGGDGSLSPGDEYTVEAAVPDPPAEELATAGAAGTSAMTALPPSVPSEVIELAQQIVTEAGAITPFAQALAIQTELRSWTYSLEPPRGHGSSAMRSFITNRIGYCEQYAGTMAVMLRSLGIPSRVAVGFTPGNRVSPAAGEDGSGAAVAGEYLVTHANAHAWVEVLFPGLGWIAFEPTPRTDGNVIVPSLATVTPGQTEAQREAQAQLPEAPPADEGFLEDLAPPPVDDAASPAGTDGTAEDPDRGRGLLGVGLGVIMLLLAAAAGSVALMRRWQEYGAVVPADRVLYTIDRVRRIGRGLGVSPAPAETDREYLARLAGAMPAAAVLATAAERARYATIVPQSDARAARSAADDVIEALLESRSFPRRLLVRVRGSLASAASGWWRRFSVPRASTDWQPTGDRVRRLIRRRSARGHG